MEQKTSISYTLLCAALAAVFFVPTLFLEDILAWKSDLLPILYQIIMACLYGFILTSPSKKIFFLKWAGSLFFSWPCFEFFWQTDFSVRSLNWVFPNYGFQTAGGAFAGTFNMGVFTFFSLIGWVIALSCSSADNNKLEKIQMRLGGVLGAVIVLVVLELEQGFPPYASVYWAYY